MESGPGGEVRLALGVDVARYGTDATAYSWIVNGLLTAQRQVYGASLMETAGRLVALHRRTPTLALALDDTGVGGGLTDRLREQGFEPLAVNFGAAALDAEHYANRGSELYQRLAQALDQGRLRLDARLPTRDDLYAQLTPITYRFSSDGRRHVRKRPTDSAPSPDLADSLALAWAAYEDAYGDDDSPGPGLW
jgi:hypothetical protein